MWFSSFSATRKNHWFYFQVLNNNFSGVFLAFQLTLRPEQTVLPLVDKSNTVERRTGVSFQHPEILAHAELVTTTLSEPYYWKLPEQFTGSMVRILYHMYLNVSYAMFIRKLLLKSDNIQKMVKYSPINIFFLFQVDLPIKCSK